MNRVWIPILGGFLLGSAVPAAAMDLKTPPVKKRLFVAAPAPRFRALAEIPEVEPNNRAADAQLVECGNSLVNAAITNVAAVPDSDFIRFEATAGELITFETASDPPDLITDTIINLIASDGVTSLISDDDSGTGFYSKITDFQAPYTGTYYGRIRGFDVSEGPYRANVTCTPAPAPPANDRCDGAPTIPYGNFSFSGTTRFATDDYDLCPGTPLCASSCTGYHSPGKDVVFKLVIENANDVVDLTYALDPPSIDASLYIVSDCGDAHGSCVAGQDSGEETVSEHLAYRFPAAGTYYVVLDAFTGGGGSWTLNGCINCVTAVRPAMTWGRLKTRYRD